MVEVVIKSLHEETRFKKAFPYLMFFSGVLLGIFIVGFAGKVMLDKVEKQQKLTRDFLIENNLISFVNYDKVGYSAFSKILSLYNPKFAGTIRPRWEHEIEKVEIKGFNDEKTPFYLDFKGIKVDIVDAIRASYDLKEVSEVVSSYDPLSHVFTMTWLDFLISGFTKLNLDAGFSALLIPHEKKLQVQFVFNLKEMGEISADLEFANIDFSNNREELKNSLNEQDGLALFLSQLDVSYFALRYKDNKLVKSYKDFVMMQNWHETGISKEIYFEEKELNSAIKDLEDRGLSNHRAKNIVENLNKFITNSEFLEIVSNIDNPIKFTDLFEGNSIDDVVKFFAKTGSIVSTTKTSSK